MAEDDLARIIADLIPDYKDIVHRLKAGFVYIAALVVVAANQVDVSVKLICVPENRSLIPVGEIPDHVYMVCVHDNSVPIRYERCIVLFNRLKWPTVETDAVPMSKMKISDIKCFSHEISFDAVICSGFKLSVPLDEDLDVTIIVKKRFFTIDVSVTMCLYYSHHTKG